MILNFVIYFCIIFVEATQIVLFTAQSELQKEKAAYSDLKQTWVNANNQFIEMQAQYDKQLKTMQKRLQLVCCV